MNTHEKQNRAASNTHMQTREYTLQHSCLWQHSDLWLLSTESKVLQDRPKTEFLPGTLSKVKYMIIQERGIDRGIVDRVCETHFINL